MSEDTHNIRIIRNDNVFKILRNVEQGAVNHENLHLLLSHLPFNQPHITPLQIKACQLSVELYASQQLGYPVGQERILYYALLLLAQERQSRFLKIDFEQDLIIPLGYGDKKKAKQTVVKTLERLFFCHKIILKENQKEHFLILDHLKIQENYAEIQLAENLYSILQNFKFISFFNFNLLRLLKSYPVMIELIFYAQIKANQREHQLWPMQLSLQNVKADLHVYHHRTLSQVRYELRSIIDKIQDICSKSDQNNDVLPIELEGEYLLIFTNSQNYIEHLKNDSLELNIHLLDYLEQINEKNIQNIERENIKSLIRLGYSQEIIWKCINYLLTTDCNLKYKARHLVKGAINKTIKNLSTSFH